MEEVGSGDDFSQDEIGDVEGLVTAVEPDRRLPNVNHELDRETVVLELAAVDAAEDDSAEHAAHPLLDGPAGEPRHDHDLEGVGRPTVALPLALLLSPSSHSTTFRRLESRSDCAGVRLADGDSWDEANERPLGVSSDASMGKSGPCMLATTSLNGTVLHPPVFVGSDDDNGSDKSFRIFAESIMRRPSALSNRATDPLALGGIMTSYRKGSLSSEIDRSVGSCRV
jgi:hypothetical protein